MSRIELALEAAALVLVAVSAARVLLKKPIRRELSDRPLLGVAFAGVAVLALAVILSLVSASPTARRSLVAAAAVAAALSWWRARPDFGRDRGLPPGSLGLTTSLDAIEDAGYYERASRRWGPVFKMRQIHRPVVCITELETGFDLFETQAGRLRQSDWAFNRLVPGGYLEYRDGPEHERLRAALLPFFTSDAVGAAREAIAEEARTQLDAMARASGAGGIHPEPFLLPIAHAGLIRMLFGVTSRHPEYETLRAGLIRLSRPMELFLPVPRATRAAFGELEETVDRLIQSAEGTASHGREVAHRSLAVERERIEPDSVLARLVGSDGARARNPAATGNLILMAKEGGIMVRGLLRWIVKMLADHREAVFHLRAAGGDDRVFNARATAFVLETIRLHESPYLYRVVDEEIELGEFRIPRGWLVRLCLAEAHRRPDAFPEPERFRPARFENRDVVPGTFRPFGPESRACPGEDLAIAIAREVVRESALGYDLRTERDGPAWRINRHWGLWRPSLRLSIRVEPRAERS